MAQITEGVCRDILNGWGYTDNEVKQLAYMWLNSQQAQTAPVVPNPIEVLRNAMNDVEMHVSERPALVGHFANNWNKALSAAPSAPIQANSEDAELYQLRHQNEYLLQVYDAAKNLVKVKGRHHSEQAYKRLADVLAATAQQKESKGGETA